MSTWTRPRSRRGVATARRHLQAAIDALRGATPGGSTRPEAVVYDALLGPACNLAAAAEGLDAALGNDELWGAPKAGKQ